MDYETINLRRRGGDKTESSPKTNKNRVKLSPLDVEHFKEKVTKLVGQDEHNMLQ